MTHPFLLSPGVWIGEGEITFLQSPNKLKFYTRWRIDPSDQGIINCVQEIELHGLEQVNENRLIITDVGESGFKISVENELMGKLSGKGVWDPVRLAWELRDQPGMEGFEVYELLPTGEYQFHAEYSSPPFKTLISGKLWMKS